MSEWKYDIDEVGEDADDADDGLDPDAPERDAGPLEPGSPSFENAFFVVLGVATTLFVFARAVLLAGG